MPDAWRIEARNAAVEPFPFVPAMSTTRMLRSGRPASRRSARIRPSRQRVARLARGFHPTPRTGSEKPSSQASSDPRTDLAIVPRHTILRGAGRMIEDLDGVIEPRPSWRARWLLPAAGGLLLGVVLTSSFFRFTPATAIARAT